MVKIMKKLAGAMVLMIFMMSIVPFALAETDAASDVAITEDDEVRDANKKNMREKAQDRRKALVDHAVEARDKAREVRKDVAEARDRLAHAKDRYKDARDKHREHKNELLRLRDGVRDCTEDCDDQKKALRGGVKEHLLKTLDVMENSLDRIAEHVEGADRLSDDQKENALERVAELEEDIAADRATVDALTEDSTPKEYRDAIKDVKETWREARKMQKRLVNGFVNAKLGVLVDKHTGIARSMEVRIDALQKRGVDTSSLEEIMAEFIAHKEELDANHQEARETCSGGDDVDACHDAQQQVREDMKESKELLREFVAEFKELKEDAADVEDDINEEEEESEEEIENEAAKEEREVEEETEEESDAVEEETADEEEVEEEVSDDDVDEEETESDSDTPTDSEEE